MKQRQTLEVQLNMPVDGDPEEIPHIDYNFLASSYTASKYVFSFFFHPHVPIPSKISLHVRPTKAQTRNARIFVSSTFADMEKEREILLKQVFPKLRKFCNSRGKTIPFPPLVPFS